MKRYSEYKDSGIEWIGEIPSHWKSVGFTRYIDSIVDYRGKTPEKVDEGVFLVTTRNIKNGRLDYSLSQEYVLEEEYKNIMSRGIPELGDVLFTMEAPLGEVANVNNTNIALAQRIIKLRGKKNKLDNYYLKYWILSSIFQQNLYTYATGSTALGIKSGKLHKLTIVLPIIQEQYKIVKYLDKKTSQIETLISKKEELIETLKACRTKLISETVTKGLDKDVPMKDSGVEWIGEMPKHWDISKVKYTTYVKGRIGWQGLRSDEFIDNGPFLVTGTDFKDGKIDWNSCYHIEDKRYNEAKQIQLKENDLLITKDGTIGKIALVINKPEKASLNSGIFVTRPLENNLYINNFMYWVLESSIFKQYIAINETGSTIKHLYQETFVNFDFMIPNKKEQEDIVNYLNKKVNEIDELLLKIQEQIELLKKAKQKLITEVVTGKIDVTNL